jgi:radical SAM protein with 4Fe4S-binding SPASM domain
MVDFNRCPLKQKIDLDEGWLPCDEHYNRYSADARKTPDCRYLWDRVAVNWDGTVAPCCRIYEKKECFGSVFAKSFRDIWNGPEYRHARSLFRGREGGSETVCDRCVALGNID